MRGYGDPFRLQRPTLFTNYVKITRIRVKNIRNIYSTDASKTHSHRFKKQSILCDQNSTYVLRSAPISVQWSTACNQKYTCQVL